MPNGRSTSRRRSPYTGAQAIDSSRGWQRCRAEGAERFALFVGAAVLANNLIIVAALLNKRSARRRKSHPINDPIVVASGIKAAASNHVASHSSPGRHRSAPKRRDKNWQIQQHSANLSPVHRHNRTILAKTHAFRDRN
jgi:hypothetical protein